MKTLDRLNNQPTNAFMLANFEQLMIFRLSFTWTCFEKLVYFWSDDECLGSDAVQTAERGREKEKKDEGEKLCFHAFQIINLQFD